MDTSKLIELTYPQIVAALEGSVEFGGDIWQTTKLGRQVYPIIEIRVDSTHDKLTLRLPANMRVHFRYEIFVRLRYRNMIFRFAPGEFKTENDLLLCRFPLEAKALEFRGSDRYVLPFETKTPLSLKKDMREAFPEIEARIIDVSERGLGIMISNVPPNFLVPTDALWIKSIDHRSLKEQLFGHVVYVSTKGYYLKQGDIRVGLALDSCISKDIFESLKQKSHKVLVA